LNAVSHYAPILASPRAETLHWPDEAATAQWAQTLAQAMHAAPYLQHAIIELHGDLGAGKTTLVRHLLRALGVTGRIKSPSYAVVEPHTAPLPPTQLATSLATNSDAPAAGELSISHFDFYRFNDPREWEDAGFRDIFTAPGLKLIEWADKARAALPVPDLAITLTAQVDDSRSVALHSSTVLGSALIDATVASASPTAAKIPAV
jgi:tRNA threonylcarbamoyladenosine biosynthesis protein TsaE